MVSLLYKINIIHYYSPHYEGVTSAQAPSTTYNIFPLSLAVTAGKPPSRVTTFELHDTERFPEVPALIYLILASRVVTDQPFVLFSL
jgi:hypothetical protein